MKVSSMQKIVYNRRIFIIIDEITDIYNQAAINIMFSLVTKLN